MSAINRVGEGQLSPLSAKIKAASVPSKPGTPFYVSSTNETITLGWNDVSDNGGSLITSFKVYADNGTLESNIFNYIGSTNSLEFTLNNTILT